MPRRESRSDEGVEGHARHDDRRNIGEIGPVARIAHHEAIIRVKKHEPFTDALDRIIEHFVRALVVRGQGRHALRLLAGMLTC